MKNIDYVKRYGPGILSGDMDALSEMVNLLLSEANCERATCHDHSEKFVNGLLEKYNRRGNTIAELFKREYGRDVLKTDWFKTCVEVGVESEGKANAQHS